MTKPSVDIGILTIRDDEFRALLAAFPEPDDPDLYIARRHYNLRLASAGKGAVYRVAILRQLDQGNGEALDAARDLLEDLSPRLVLVVGIAGGLPRDDLTLGDVVLSTRVHDYSVEARKENAAPAYALSGGPIDKALAAAIVNLPAREAELGAWTEGLPAMPPADAGEDHLYGPDTWKAEVRASIGEHFGSGPRTPTYVAGVIATSDRLVKDVSVIIPWLETTRHLLAVEMESGGVYRAGRDRAAVLAIRGISDIVGLKRDSRWTKYACAVAAAFTRAFLQTRPLPLVPRVAVAAAPVQARAAAAPIAGSAAPVRELIVRELQGKELKALMDALVDAFPRPDDLRVLVRVGLDENLDVLVGAGGLQTMVFELIQQTEARGKTNALLAAAFAERPDNAKLRAFVDSRTVPTSTTTTTVGQPHPGASSVRAVSTRSVLALLQAMLVGASDFDLFCLTHFREVYQRFTNGMDRTTRSTLLIERVPLEDIVEALRRSDPPRFARHEHLLEVHDAASR